MSVPATGIFGQTRDGQEVCCLRNGTTGNYTTLFLGGWDVARGFPGTHYTTKELWKANDDTFSSVTRLADMPFRAHTFCVIRDDNNHARALVYPNDYYYLTEGDNPALDMWIVELNNSGVPTWTALGLTAPQLSLVGARILCDMAYDDGGWILLGGQKSGVAADGLFTDALKITVSGYTATVTQIATGLTQFGMNVSGTLTSNGTELIQIAGGLYDTTPTYTSQYYLSADGITWTSQTALPILGVGYPRVVYLLGKIFIITGYRQPEGNLYDVYWIDTNGSLNVLANYSNKPAGWYNTHACGGAVCKRSDGTEVIVIGCGNQFDFIAVIEKI